MADAERAAEARLWCRHSGREEPPIVGPIPFREPLRSQLRAEVGDESWRVWLEHQLRLINEYRLNLSTPQAQELLERAVRAFFKLDQAGEGEAGEADGCGSRP
jgi:Fe-S cluster biosynthesis and repair protein YggX